MVLATLEVGTAAEEEEFERSYQDQVGEGLGAKKVSKTVSSGISSLRSNATGKILKGKKLERSEKFSATRQLVRYCAATQILPALRRESISMLGVQLQLAATTSAPSSTWPLGPKGPLCICAGRCWSIKFCLTRRGR